jgi:hypothetical protein
MNWVGAAIHSIKEDEREFQYQAKAVGLKGIVRIKNDAAWAIGCEYDAALFACPRLSGAEQQAREFGSAVSGSDVEGFDVADLLICEIGEIGADGEFQDSDAFARRFGLRVKDGIRFYSGACEVGCNFLRMIGGAVWPKFATQAEPGRGVRRNGRTDDEHNSSVR